MSDSESATSNPAPIGLLSLIALSFLLAFLWRLEIEVRNWQGLFWVEYFHLAVPVGGTLFLGWVAWISHRTPLPRSVILLVAAWGLVSMFTLDHLLVSYFGRWSFFYLSFFLSGLPEGLAVPLLLAAFWIFWLAHIVVLYAGYRRFFSFPKKTWLIGCSAWTFSWFLGLIVITILPEKGYHDLIHSFKTGWMIPFCVWGVGLPIATFSDQHRS